jgi:hypothetical protein
MLKLSDTWASPACNTARVYYFDVERLTVPAYYDEKISFELQTAWHP